MNLLGQVRGVILDVDGVLLDARPSYHSVAEEAARRAIAPLVGEKARSVPFDREPEIAAFKAAGRFNDDWEMSRGIALLLLLRARGEAPPLEDFLARAKGRGVAGLFKPIRPLAQKPSRSCGFLYVEPVPRVFGFDIAEDAGCGRTKGALPDGGSSRAVAARFLALYAGRNPARRAWRRSCASSRSPTRLLGRRRPRPSPIPPA